jgi:integrase
MASIEKRGDSYRFSVSCGYDSKGKKLSEKMTWTPDPGMTEKQEKKEADRQADAFEQRVKNGLYLGGEKMTFSEFVDVWKKEYAEKHLRPKTRSWYYTLLDGRVVPALGHLKLAKIQTTHLIQFMNNLTEPGMNENVQFVAKPGIREKAKASGLKASAVEMNKDTLSIALSGKPVSKKTAGMIAKAMNQTTSSLFTPTSTDLSLSSTTQGHYRRCLHSVFGTALAMELIVRNPCTKAVRSPRSDKKETKHLEIEEAQSLIEAALLEKDTRIRVAILLLLYTGIRRGELAGLEWDDIDLENGTISVSRNSQARDGGGVMTGGTKTESGTRSFNFDMDLVRDLKEHRSIMAVNRLKCGDAWVDSGRVITGWTGEPIHPTTIYHWVKRFLLKNGFPEMTVHGLRHSSISLMLSQGVDLITVSKRAGHAKPSTTADIYAHAMRRNDEEAAKKLGSILRPRASIAE